MFDGNADNPASSQTHKNLNNPKLKIQFPKVNNLKPKA
jgi:hypothetical protein